MKKHYLLLPAALLAMTSCVQENLEEIFPKSPDAALVIQLGDDDPFGTDNMRLYDQPDEGEPDPDRKEVEAEALTIEIRKNGTDRKNDNIRHGAKLRTPLTKDAHKISLDNASFTGVRK